MKLMSVSRLRAPLCRTLSGGANDTAAVAAKQRSEVLGGYRRLMRARTTLFAGDAHAMAESRIELKKNFADKAGERDPAVIEKHIEEIYDVEGFMKFNLAQGVMNEGGSFEVVLTEDHNAGHPDGVEVNHVDNMSAVAANPSVIVESSNAAAREPLPER